MLAVHDGLVGTALLGLQAGLVGLCLRSDYRAQGVESRICRSCSAKFCRIRRRV